MTKPIYGKDANGNLNKKVILNPQQLIYQLPTSVDTFVRESYSGGAVDVYIPWYNKILSNMPYLYYYDVNSLFPYCMAKFELPVGLPTLFEGDISKVNPDAYGFFSRASAAPEYLEHPILQRKIRTSSGIRTIAGLGTWFGIINSDEMKNAPKYGYTFKILGGVTFKKANIFKNFVHDLYEMRRQYPKSDPMNLICKLLMNSLYGKFGQSLIHDSLEIYDISDPEKLKIVQNKIEEQGNSIKDWITIDEKIMAIVTATNASTQCGFEDDENYHGSNTNVAIASSITSLARVVMSFYKNNPLWRLFYSDTYSIIIDKELPKEMVGNEIGMMKWENRLTGAICLAPKVYCLITEKGEVIKKIKGVSSSAIENFGWEDFENLLSRNTSYKFVQDKWLKTYLKEA